MKRIAMVIGQSFGWLSCWAVPVLAADADTLDRMPANQAIPVLTQRLLSALPGDTTVWRRYLSDSMVYVSEAGEVAGKQELLEAFMPFPPGLSGTIAVKQPRIVSLGDLAISTFEADERQTVYDQHLAVKYRATHTWRRENGGWRLVAAQNLVVPQDVRPLPIDRGRLADYAGVYELSRARKFRIERRADLLYGGRDGSRLIPLVPVGDNVFADSGSSLGVIRIFVRGPKGRVDRMVQRRKFADLDWLKVAEPDPGTGK